MADIELGRLSQVDLREIWATEAGDFTPWLAREDNLAVLSDSLGIELELEAQEKSVGPFRADILCREVENGSWVLIENQLERTDHSHLGQLLTYASGLQAVTIVWIAARFTDEHRSTLDWLNHITDERFRFFGLEVELWKIGESLAAPKFNIVSKPNSWSRSIARATRAIDEGELSATKILQLKYWTAFLAVLEADDGPVGGSRKPQPASWMTYPVGRSGFQLVSTINRAKRQVRAEMYIIRDPDKIFFRQLLEDREAIEGDFGAALGWEALPDRAASRIADYLHEANIDNEAEWPRQHAWLAQTLARLHRVFAPRLAGLDRDADGGRLDVDVGT